ncbi:MAG: alpha/beta hydrolase-fold protein, partial [Bacteroidota bacterium]
FFKITSVLTDQYKTNKKRKEYMANLGPSAASNVQTLPDTILIDYLNEKRTLYVFLPKSYEQSQQSYPVIYFMDGGALFDDMVLNGPEWQIDEVINETAKVGGPEAIVIGIENAEYRNPELMPFDARMHDSIPNTGVQHAEWIATDLKAWADSTYRTKPKAENTTIGGASLGGLMSYYMLMTYPDVFGNAIVFSPSFWASESLYSMHNEISDLDKHKIYFNVGSMEGGMVADTKRMYKTLLKAGMSKDNLKFDEEPRMGHWHPTWRTGFQKAYPWIIER